ncbi:MAG: hypothetical protein Q9206_007297, partial [Seirophora lacunosa]
MNAPSCPFCPFSNPSPYFLAQHVEAVHPEKDEPPFVSRHFLDVDLPGDGGREVATTCRGVPSQDYIECECGETVLLSEFNDHVQLHAAESADMAVGTAQLPAGVTLSSSHQSVTWPMMVPPVQPVDQCSALGGCNIADSAGDSYGSLLSKSNASPRNKRAPKNAKRLGKAELGPYAHEEQMPAWLYRHLQQGAKVSVINEISPCGRSVRLEMVANESSGILPVLAQLCEQDRMLSKVYLCHSGVQHIFKMAKEGGFCGYRNIQMMISYIQAARAEGYDYFPGRVPSIL